MVKNSNTISAVSAPELLVTFDEQRTDHLITDDQLMKLAIGGKDISFQVFIASIGISIGFLQNAYIVYNNIVELTVPTVWDMIAATLFVVSLTTAVISAFSTKHTWGEVDRLVTSIKDRKIGRMPAGVGKGAEPPA